MEAYNLSAAAPEEPIKVALGVLVVVVYQTVKCHQKALLQHQNLAGVNSGLLVINSIFYYPPK